MDSLNTLDCGSDISNEKHENKSENNPQQTVKRAMLEHLSTHSNVVFKPLDNEEVLTTQQKLDIAESLLNKSYGLFLARFGHHLLQEHLCYFEDADDEERVIVNVYLNQLNNIFLKKKTSAPSFDMGKSEVDEMEICTELNKGDLSKTLLRNELLDHLSLNTVAHFRSQQMGDPELSVQEKRGIAEDLLNHSSEMFLARFGTHLLEKHLHYFDSIDSYGVKYHLTHLRRNHCKGVSQIGIKNRRFEALKKMLEKGSYFSESEMRNRNPLLYEQLVGWFLTPEERKERLNVDTSNFTFSSILLEHIDQEAVNRLKKEQEDAENDAKEDDDYSDDEMEVVDDNSEDDNDLDKTLWGEEYSDDRELNVKKKPIKNERKQEIIKKSETEMPEQSDSEKQLLMEEFRTNMFSSFIQGKDVNFDYSEVDYNSDYDDLDIQTQDAEEKYFDDESSQEACSSKISDQEDVLDEYLNTLKPDPTPSELAQSLLNMNTNTKV